MRLSLSRLLGVRGPCVLDGTVTHRKYHKMISTYLPTLKLLYYFYLVQEHIVHLNVCIQDKL